MVRCAGLAVAAVVAGIEKAAARKVVLVRFAFQWPVFARLRLIAPEATEGSRIVSTVRIRSARQFVDGRCRGGWRVAWVTVLSKQLLYQDIFIFSSITKAVDGCFGADITGITGTITGTITGITAGGIAGGIIGIIVVQQLSKHVVVFARAFPCLRRRRTILGLILLIGRRIVL